MEQALPRLRGRGGREEPQVVDNYHNRVYIPILGAANECGTLSAKVDTAATRKGKKEGLTRPQKSMGLA